MRAVHSTPPAVARPRRPRAAVARAGTLVDLLAHLSLESTLDLATSTHTLDAARFDLPGGERRFALGQTARPIVVAQDVEITLGAGAVPPFALDTHGFTLRLGSLLRDGFVSVPPQPADGRYGRDLVAGVAGPFGTTGCQALSAVACPAAGLSSSCLASACSAALPTLDGVLARPFTLADGAGLDLVWSGAAIGTDADLDLIVETLGAGTWSATLTLGDASTLPITATFTGAAIP
jgi:hypothetical protein